MDAAAARAERVVSRVWMVPQATGLEDVFQAERIFSGL